MRPTPRYGNTRTYIVFNPRFEQDPTWQEFVVKADEKHYINEINWRDNPFFPESLERQTAAHLIGDAGRYNWIWEGKFLTISDAAILAKNYRYYVLMLMKVMVHLTLA